MFHFFNYLHRKESSKQSQLAFLRQLFGLWDCDAIFVDFFYFVNSAKNIPTYSVGVLLGVFFNLPFESRLTVIPVVSDTLGSASFFDSVVCVTTGNCII